MIRALWFPASLFAICSVLTFWHPVFWLGVFAFTADMIGRWRDYVFLSQLSKHNRRQLWPIYAKTMCGRQAMIAAHGEDARWYFYIEGYRVWHIFPDNTFTKKSPFLKVAFWKGLSSGHVHGSKKK